MVTPPPKPVMDVARPVKAPAPAAATSKPAPMLVAQPVQKPATPAAISEPIVPSSMPESHQPMAVHKAPNEEGDEPAADTPNPKQDDTAHQPPSVEAKKAVPQARLPAAPHTSTAPVGLITSTILVMAILMLLTVMVYIKSN